MQNPPKPHDPQIQSGSTEVSIGTTNVLKLNYKLAGLLCYLPFCAVNLIFSVIWLVTEPKDNRFLRFHALQSLVLCVAYLALAIVVWATSMVLIAIPFLRFLVFLEQIPWLLVTLGYVGINIFAMIKAYNGVMYRLPYAAEIADKYLLTA